VAAPAVGVLAGLRRLRTEFIRARNRLDAALDDATELALGVAG